MKHSTSTKNTPQLILLDHGLHKTLVPELRANYAGLWKSLVFANVDGIESYSLKLGAGEDYTLFASVMTMRPWRKVVDKSHDHLQFSIEQEDVDEIQDYAAASLREVAELLRRLPRVILLLLNTNDCLRAVDNALVCEYSSTNQ
ncbi:putative ABC1 protein At2g40090 isoform X2 [Physcomitrium patens]|uniref:putative ABC1 protein At2g40090 isoform X2 n=1 Tax=Physcomitrium patens TaxID=3218 RepID=UPI003CCD566B